MDLLGLFICRKHNLDVADKLPLAGLEPKHRAQNVHTAPVWSEMEASGDDCGASRG